MLYSKAIVTGTFDILHPGYIQLLREAKRNSDDLIVMVREDVISTKPALLFSLSERLQALAAIKYVDIVQVYSNETQLYEYLKYFTENYTNVVRVMGDDYIGKDFTGKELFDNIIYVDRSHGWSTTKIKEDCARSLGR